MKKHRFLSACLSLSLLTNTTNCFCVSKSEGKEPDSTKTANIKKVINKEKIKKVVTSKPAKTVGKIGLGLVAAKGIYEGIFYGCYYKNRKVFRSEITPYNITKAQVEEMNLNERLKLASDWLEDLFVVEAYTTYSGVSAICYSVMDAVSFNNAKQMQKINEKRLIAFGRGVCRNYALMVSFLLDKLSIKNHICVSISCDDKIHVFNSFHNGHRWRCIDATEGKRFISPFKEIKEIDDKYIDDVIEKHYPTYEEKYEKSKRINGFISPVVSKEQIKEIFEKIKKNEELTREEEWYIGYFTYYGWEEYDATRDYFRELIGYSYYIDNPADLYGQSPTSYSEPRCLGMDFEINMCFPTRECYVLESSDKWENKYQSDLKIISLKNFLQNGGWNDNCKFEKLGKKINLFKHLTHYYS